jgi:hypothetical protein
MTHPNNSATPNGDPGSVGEAGGMSKREILETIEASAKRLRLGIEGPRNAELLERAGATIERLYAENEVMRAELEAKWDDADKLAAVEAERDELRAKLSAPAGAASAEASRYPWKDAPEWAMWAATCSNGRAFWYSHKPYLAQGVPDRWEWDSRAAHIEGIPALPFPDWRDSLEPRPAADGGVE